jgi:hypothetical protein
LQNRSFFKALLLSRNGTRDNKQIVKKRFSMGIKDVSSVVPRRGISPAM